MANKVDLKIDTAAIKDTLINFIVPLICFGVSGLMILVVIYPSIQKLPALKTDLQSKTTLRTQLDTKATALDKIIDYKSVIEEDLTLIDKVLVTDDNIPYLLNQIDKIARDTGFKLSRLNYGQGSANDIEKGDSSAEYVAVNMGVTGTYEQLVTFLKNTETAARLLNVTNLRYSLATSESTEGLSISLLLYSPYMQVNSKASTDDPISLDIANPDFVKTINALKTYTFYENQPPSATLKAEEKPLEEVVNPTPEVKEENGETPAAENPAPATENPAPTTENPAPTTETPAQ